HRDVKPENVLVAEAPSGGPGNLVDSVVKVADFGLARAVEASAEDETGGQLMATVAYVAPELVTDGRADPRTDVYSAGIVLFEMLTGRVPYDGGPPVEIAWQHVDRDVPAPSSIVAGTPPALDDLVVRATRREAHARPTDAGSFLAQVQVVRDDLGNANANTAVLRQVSGPTVTMSAVPAASRPAWARLPGQQSEPRRPPGRAAAAAGRSAIRDGATRLMAGSRGRTAVAAAIVVIGLVAAVGGWWYGIGRYTAAPQMVNMTRAAAVQQAQQAGFQLAFGPARYDEQAAKDVVLSQDPPAAGRVVKGGTITLVLSLGPERYAVPDVVGKQFDLAKSDLERDKLVVVKAAEAYSDTLPAGVVVKVVPDVGTKVKPGDKVELTLSKGKAPLSVPNVLGKNVNEARQILAGMGMQPLVNYKQSDKPKDQVIGQTPVDGTGVEQGAEVKLDVSEGPPMVTVPPVVGQPCQQAKAQLEGLQLQVNIQVNPNGSVAAQNPAENTPVAPGTQVVLVCL
ncbi:MAG TPA: PASTA domain-containing protein, partial [Asanoa sp.]